MTDNNSRIVYGVHTISNIIESDKAKVKKIFFRKGELNKNLTNLHKKALNAVLYIKEVETDQLPCYANQKDIKVLHARLLIQTYLHLI